MGIFSRKNQYLGINPHYNSYLQHEPGGWPTFHGHYVVRIADLLDELLPTGYFTRAERSLQITAPPESFFQRPDVTVYKDLASPSAPSIISAVAVPTFAVEALKVMPEPEADLMAVVVYRVLQDGTHRPVTRMELFSPSNKPPHAGVQEYLTRRIKVLESGVNLVEIDFLHESQSPFLTVPSFRRTKTLADYSQQETNAYPYYIAVTPIHPEPPEIHVQTYFYCCHVDDPLPIIAIPLLADQKMSFDFGRAYDEAFERQRFTGMVSDYSQRPIGFESYTPIDRARIERRMQAVQKAAAAGMDLEQGPFALEE